MGARHKKTFYNNMTPSKALEIRRLYFTEKVKQKQIGEIYGIPQGSVSRIISGQVWA